MYEKAAEILKEARYVVAFSGAGISVESGIPLFSGWDKFDPYFLDIGYFQANARPVWVWLKKWIYDYYGRAKPNCAHLAIARLLEKRIIRTVITMNFDGLHQKAGAGKVIELCGSTKKLVCLQCHQKFEINEIGLEKLPPRCPQCGGLLKPDILFYGEPMPEPANTDALKEANRAKVVLVVGAAGVWMPAGLVPMLAKRRRRATIIEINPNKTRYTDDITDVFIRERAVAGLQNLVKALQI